MDSIYIALSHNANQPKAEGEIEEFKKWVLHVGGEHVEDNSMDDIFCVPAQHLAEIKEIHQKYMDHFGVGLNIGVGANEDEAHEALLAGEQLQESGVNFAESLNQDEESEQSEESEVPVDGEEVAPEAQEESEAAQEQQAQTEDSEGEPEESQPEESEEESAAPSGKNPFPPKKGESEIPEGQPGHEEAESPEEEAQEGIENPEEEQQEQTLGQEIPEEEQAPEVAPEAAQEQQVAAGNEQPDNQQQEQIEAETENQEPSEVDHMYNMYQANSDDQDAVLDGQSAEQSKQFIKQKITEVLEAFKNNQQMLQEAQQTNPELHAAIIQMLRTMIDLGKISLYDKEPSDVMKEDEIDPSAENPM